ncbi:hypothetical protein ACFXJ5_31420 [Streptomyces sp. NPDC059373]
MLLMAAAEADVDHCAMRSGSGQWWYRGAPENAQAARELLGSAGGRLHIDDGEYLSSRRGVA